MPPGRPGQAGIRNQMAVVRASDYAPSKAAFDSKWARQQAVLAKLSPEVLMRRWVLSPEGGACSAAPRRAAHTQHRWQLAVQSMHGACMMAAACWR